MVNIKTYFPLATPCWMACYADFAWQPAKHKWAKWKFFVGNQHVTMSKFGYGGYSTDHPVMCHGENVGFLAFLQ